MTKLSVEPPTMHTFAVQRLSLDHWACPVHHSSVPLTAAFSSMPEVGDLRHAEVTSVMNSSTKIRETLD